MDLYPSNAAYLPVRHGAAAIGNTARYARVFAWETKSGFAYGMIRRYVGEFARIGLNKPGIDLFTAPLPEHSQAIRTAHPTVLDRIRSGAACQIGWLTLNDEIELEPNVWTSGTGKIGAFMSALPERHWYLSGLVEPARISIRPSLVSREGADESTPGSVTSILADSHGLKIALNTLLGSDGCTIIRRTITGSVRWADHGMPSSWKPREAAERAFGP